MKRTIIILATLALVVTTVAFASDRLMVRRSVQSAAQDETARLVAWLRSYDEAFNAKSLDRLALFYHPDVTIFEGGGANNGWADYRDHHLGPELAEFENLQFTHANTKVHILGDGQSAYVTADYSLKAVMGGTAIDSGGLETLILLKGQDGTWKIRHSHTSARRRS